MQDKFVERNLGLLKNLHIAQHSAKTFADTKKTPTKVQDGNSEYKQSSQFSHDTLQKLKQKSNDHKHAAQRFLLDQIKNGWPYDERYYHTESMS